MTASGATETTDPGPRSTAEQRLAVVADLAAVRWRADPVLLPSHSNDTWVFDDPARGDCVLRICWRGDPGRMITEARIGRALPPAFGASTVLGFGATRDESGLTWSLTRRWPGRPLGEVWRSLSAPEQRRAAADVGARLRSLHRWRPSAYLTDRLLAWPRSTDPVGIAGATLNPLPIERVTRLAAGLASRTELDPTVVDRAVGWLASHADLAPGLDRPGLPVTHGDLHLQNIWWDDEHQAVRGLLDFEWARLAEPWVDLARLADNADEDRLEGHDAHGRFLELLLAAAPELDVDGRADRLRYVRIAHQLRQLLFWPPVAPDSTPDHPARMLESLLA